MNEEDNSNPISILFTSVQLSLLDVLVLNIMFKILIVTNLFNSVSSIMFVPLIIYLYLTIATIWDVRKYGGVIMIGERVVYENNVDDNNDGDNDGSMV
jgi:hypothetical protein